MSDSDDDLLENNMFPNENTLLRGNSFIKNLRSNGIPSSTFNNTMFMPNHRPTDVYDRTRMLYRRQTSPVSMQSVPESRPHHFISDYRKENSYQRSLGNRRSQSPASVRSVDSTVSVSAYIAEAFKTTKFNKFDLRVIKDAYNRYLKNRMRKRIGRKRNLKLLLKRHRQKSGDDSGEQGSDSSISSDDDRFKRYTSSRDCILRSGNLTDKNEMVNNLAVLPDNDMYKTCTETIKQNMTHNKLTAPIINNNTREGGSNPIITLKDRFAKSNQLPYQRFSTSIVNTVINNSNSNGSSRKVEECPISNEEINYIESENEEIFFEKSMREKGLCYKRPLESIDNVSSDIKRNKLNDNNLSIDRTQGNDNTFKKPQIPLKKIVKPKANFLTEQASKVPHLFLTNNHGQTPCVPISNNSMCKIKSSQSIQNVNRFLNNKSSIECKMTDDRSTKVQIVKTNKKDELLTDNMLSNNKKNTISKKSDKTDVSNNKKIKSPTKQRVSNRKTQTKCANVKKISADNLEEPQESLCIDKNEVRTNLGMILNSEKLISKSLQLLVGNVETIDTYEKGKVNGEKEEINNFEIPMSISEVSTKPSFIRRKLFTQKLDITEDKNSSIDSTSSLQTQRYNFREKTKVRKLATSQSCLSHDVGEENILDLIHKIVPADQINITSLSNKRDIRESNVNEEKQEPLTTTATICNNDNESDTFADEEIFGVGMANKQPRTHIKTSNNQDTATDILQNLETSSFIQPKESSKVVPAKKCASKKTVSSCVRSFWDTDIESDVDDLAKNILKPPANQISGNKRGNVKGKSKLLEKQLTTKATLLSSSALPEQNIKEKSVQTLKKVSTAKVSSHINEYEKKKPGPKPQNKLHQKPNEFKVCLNNDSFNSSTTEHSVLTRKRSRNRTMETSSQQKPKVVNSKLSKKTTNEITKEKRTLTQTTNSAGDVAVDSKIKTAKTRMRRLKANSCLNDSLNQSINNRSVLTRSLSKLLTTS